MWIYTEILAGSNSLINGNNNCCYGGGGFYYPEADIGLLTTGSRHEYLHWYDAWGDWKPYSSEPKSCTYSTFPINRWHVF